MLANHDNRKVMMRAVDSNVLVLDIAAAQQLSIYELWIVSTSGKIFDTCQSMRLHVPVTQSSAFAGHRKTTVWDIWKTFNDLSPAFCNLSSTPRSVDDQLDVLESFVVLLCDRASREEKMNLARKQLSSQKSRRIEGPTQAALAEHIKRAAYQAGHIWAQMFVAVPNLPSPGDWRWLPTIEGGWEVKCRSFSHAEASRACRELIRCGVGGSANMRNHFFSVLVSVCVKDCETLRDVDDAV